jgi:clan AA aspartic protease (TIGR02281 family)
LGGVLLISARISGQKTELLFDSGAALTVINHKFAEYFGIQIDPTRQIRITAASEKEVDTFLSIAQEIRVGSVIRKDLPVSVIKFSPNFEVHGLIGMNFLKGLRFTVEMDTGTLILRQPKKR